MYVGVSGKARKVKEMYVGVNKPLPSGYTRVAYIQGTGSQYINTGFKPKSTTRAVLDIDVTAKSSQSAIFGARNGSASAGFNVWTYNNNAGYQFDYGTQQFYPVGGTSSGRHTIEINQNVLSVDGSTVQTASSQSFSCSYEAYIFTVKSGSSLMTGYPCSAKLYSCRIYDNGTLVRDFVPCKNSSGTVGLYDVVGSKFYTNAGSGSFTAGSTYDSSVLLMLHGNLNDESSYSRKITNSGVTVSSAQSKFGGESLYFNGSAANFTVPNLISGTGPFTVDYWVYPTASKTNIMWSHGGSNAAANTGGVISLDADNTANYYCSGYRIDGTLQCPVNKWSHIAVVGNGSSIKLYVNGVCAGTYSANYNFTSDAEMFGANQSYTVECFTGYIDEIRVSNVERWTSNFTPPTSAYAPSDNGGGFARKVKKAYVGVGGVARLFFISPTAYKYISWTQPVLTSNGTVGGSSFAVSASSYHDSPRQPYCAFDGVTTNNSESGCWHSSAYFPQWIQFYNPNPLKVSKITIMNRSENGAWIDGYGISYSDDGTNFTEFTTGNSPSQFDSGTFSVAINQEAHKYWRITAYSASGANFLYVAIGEIKIEAQELVENAGS